MIIQYTVKFKIFRINITYLAPKAKLSKNDSAISCQYSKNLLTNEKLTQLTMIPLKLYQM